MPKGLIAQSTITIAAPRARVWEALVSPAAIKQYVVGTEVITDWTTGGSIVWQGEWQGKAYRDTGVVLQIEPEHILPYSHFSPLAGLPATPEHHHVLTICLAELGTGTQVSLSQDNNPTEDARRHSEQNWASMLAALKTYLEQ